MINKRHMKKTASGIVLQNSTPAGIEHFLTDYIKEALGEFKDIVTIKPYLQINDQDADLSGNVKNAFGAVELSVYGVKLFIPFIIADKTLLPFDVIRMGDQEVSYDYSKLRKLVNAIEHKAKAKENGENGGPFQTMELADFKDIQPNNGFLGNIMVVRDMARQRDSRGDYPWSGSEFGVVSDERLQKQASVPQDVFEIFHDVMEKIAGIKVYTQAQIDEYEQHIRKQAKKEVMSELEKTAAAPTMEDARVKRDMIQLSEEKLFDVRRAASGNDISFPVFSEGSLEYRSGRVYHQFKSWFENSKDYTSGKLNALVLDSKGGYSLLKSNQPFMASVREPGTFKLVKEQAKSLRVSDQLYVLEDGTTIAYNPFIVGRSYVRDTLNNGMVVSMREDSIRDLPSRTNNSLFLDVLSCEEVFPGRYNDSYSDSPIKKTFHLVIVKDPEISKPTFMNETELKNYITSKAKDLQDARLAYEMVAYNDSNILIPEDLEFFVGKKNIKDYYTRPDGLFKQGPMAKEASFDNLNKARLVVTHDRQPKMYSVQWQYTDEADAGGVNAKRLIRHSADSLSRSAAQSMLQKLGFDYRTQAQFFEITERNGRSATFGLPDLEKARQAAPEKQVDTGVKKKMNGLANNMLHSKNFLPLLANNIGDGLSLMLSEAVPGSINAAHSVSNAFGFGKQSMETAREIEKVAAKINGEEWHELSALLNMKYRLDKLASEIMAGHYLYQAEPVFEKVAELKPFISKKASDLIDFNRKQLLRTSSYIVEPSLVKQAVHQLDGLSLYAGEVKKKDPLTKTAGLFSAGPELAEADRAASGLAGRLGGLENKFNVTQAKLRAALQSDSQKLDQILDKANTAEADYKEGSQSLQNALKEAGGQKQKEATKNMAIAGSIGIPGLAGLGYGFQSERNKLETNKERK